MTDDERDRIKRRLYRLFPAIRNLASPDELEEWDDTLAALDYDVAAASLRAGKLIWKCPPSHAEFREVYDAHAPRSVPAVSDSLSCDGIHYVLADPLLADDFAAERERATGRAGRSIATQEYSRTGRDRIRGQLAGANGAFAGPLADALDERELGSAVNA